jgi:predicted secreted protein
LVLLLRVSKKTTVKISPRYQVWWYILIIPVPKRQRQKDQFKASLGYVPRPSLKKKKRKSTRATVISDCN